MRLRGLTTLGRLGLVALAVALGARCGGKDAGATTVVLVTVDTLRQDHVGAFAPAGRPSPAKTPRMDALARSGLRFVDARTPVPLTLPAHTTMLSGLPPAVHGVRSNSASRVPSRTGRPWPLVTEALADAGFCCGAFVSGGALVERYGLSAGFSTYDDGDLDDRTGAGYGKRAGIATVTRALAWLATLRKDSKAFLWVHLFDPHDPYRGDYATSVEDADAAVGALVDGLAAAGRADATIVLTSDHGESLGDHGEATHGFLLGESVLRVPFVVRRDGVEPGSRDDPVDLADVARTVAHAAGIAFSIPPGVGSGHDLLAGAVPPARPRVAEALHASHQHRWAQLTCAVVHDRKLLDRGEAPGRPRLLLRLRRDAPPWEDAGTPAEGDPAATAPADALRAYLRSETDRPDEGGTAAGGYGAGGPVGRFLDPVTNGKRPDPYAVISDAGRLATAASAVLATPPVPARLDAAGRVLETLVGRDPSNPAIPFWQGRVFRTIGRHADAGKAFQRALDLGRLDPDTLLLTGRSNLDQGDPHAVTALLDAYRARIPADPRVLELAAEAWARLGDGAKAADAASRAKALRAARAKRAAEGCR